MAKLILGDDLVLPKTRGKGIMLDGASPSYGWRDIEGLIQPKATGAGSPTHATIRGNVDGYAFALSDHVDFTFHIPHDFLPDSDLYWHIHWLHTGTNISGTLELTNYFSYAKGHNQANFPADITALITYATVDLATTPQYRHRIDEIQISAASPSGSQLDSNDIEVDGIILAKTVVTQLPTITGGSLFLLYGDLHYQSIDGGTKQRSPDFFT